MSVPDEKIAFIHHGIPDTPFLDSSFNKDKFGVEGKKVLLTFGLLSPNKGIENVLQALPAVIKKHPDAVYIILGATHPHILKFHGDAYRIMLQQLVRQLDIGEHVIFQNRFVELKELCEFLGIADLYVTPYLEEAQIVSGTLAYAMGTGNSRHFNSVLVCHRDACRRPRPNCSLPQSGGHGGTNYRTSEQRYRTARHA